MNENITSPEVPEEIPIKDWAEKDKRNVLVNYIEYASPRIYKFMGLKPEDFIYSSENQTLEIQFVGNENQEGHKDVIHGGFLAFLVDASAGALAMTMVGNEVTKEELATTAHLNMDFNRPAFSNTPTRVVSYIDKERYANQENQTGKRNIFLKTDIYQGETLVAAASVKLASQAAERFDKVLEREKRNRTT